MNLPVLRLTRLSDAELSQLMSRVLNSMREHPDKFAGLAARLDSLESIVTAFKGSLQAVTDARPAFQALVDVKDSDRANAEAVMRSLASFVSDIAKGDVTTIHMAGMDVRGEPRPVMMPKVEKLRVTPSVSDGELIARWMPVRGCRLFDVQVCKDQTQFPRVWVDKLRCTKARCALNHDLVSGTKVGVRVRAVGPNNQGPWSSEAWKTVP